METLEQPNVPSWTTDDVKDFMDTHRPDTFNLIDVRTAAEYEQMHLPGAHLIPLPDLPERLGEIDRYKHTIVYCRSGRRSLSASAILLGAGLTDVFNMAGGINMWEGLVSEGPPEAGASLFAGTKNHIERIFVAWVIKDGLCSFYAGLKNQTDDEEAAALFDELTHESEEHKNSLLALYKQIGGPTDIRSLGLPIPEDDLGEIMEGGVRIADALKWAKGKDMVDTLDYLISLESNSYDLYIKMGKMATDDNSRKVYQHLATEEKNHLVRLSELLDERL